MTDRWKAQWARVERYYERLHDARFGRLPPEQLWTPERRAQFHDDAYSFFVHAFHLREWLKADGIDVMREFESSQVLRLCADIANATKHVELDRPRIGQPRQEHTSVVLILQGEKLTVGTDIVLSIDGKSFSGFGFAKRVRVEWISVLTARGLSFELREFEEPKLRMLRPVPDAAVPEASRPES